MRQQLTRTTPVLLSLAMTLVTSAAYAEGFTVVTGLAFSDAAPSLTLDLYRPEATDQPVPCIIVIQGGGFRPQDGQRFKPFAEHLAANGFVAALISYRGRPEHQYRDTLADIRTSVRYIRHVSAEYGIDATRIGATGRSAGGALAALLAVTGDEEDPECRIQAAVCFAGVFDFITRFTDAEQLSLQPNQVSRIRSNAEWIGAAFSADDEHWQAASAISHVDPHDPPILFLHARDDSSVPWLQSRDMHRAMTDRGVASEVRIYESGGHAVRPPGEKPLDEMVAFFRTHLVEEAR